MIIYSDRIEPASTWPSLVRLRGHLDALPRAAAPPHDEVTDLLVEFGRLESALADALMPHRDGVPPPVAALRAAALALGALFRASALGDPAWKGAARAAAAAVSDLAELELPARVGLKTLEGFAYYGLHPETYLDAARAFAEARRPERAVVLGLRGIGAPLSAVVAAELAAHGCAVESCTLRPHGHPFDRRPALDDALAAQLADGRGAWFLVVDEGPGLSGSSLCGTAEMLAGLGVPDARIVLLPSWDADGAGFRSPAARERWERHPRHVGRFETAVVEAGRLDALAAGRPLRDWSAGAWRGDVLPEDLAWPAVQPQHERRKLLARDGNGGHDDRLLKFAGVGHGADRRRKLAATLADGGWTAPPVASGAGFLALRLVRGTPMRGGEASGAFLDHAADYLVFRRERLVPGGAEPFEALVEMARHNAREGLGPAWGDRLGWLDSYRDRVLDAVPVAVDGRMLPHEWLRRDDGGWTKADALDHHDDHFFPGSVDGAWDLAGLAVEWSLPPEAVRRVADRYAAATGDRTAADRLPFHRAAYAAFRLGYCTMAAQSLGPAGDGARMLSLARRYAHVLREAAASGAAGPHAVGAG